MLNTYDRVILSSSCGHLPSHQEVFFCTPQFFDDGEMAVDMPRVGGLSVLYVTSMAGGSRLPHDHLMEACITLRALKQKGASHVTVGAVYSAYTRGCDEGALVYNLLTTAGANHLWVLDPHVPAMPPVETRTMMPTFAEDIVRRFDHPLIVSPDIGGVARAAMVAQLTQSDIVRLHKQRIHNQVTITHMEGTSPRNRVCILVDDVMQSGGTLMAAAQYLTYHGAEEVHAYVTHHLACPDVARSLSAVLASLTTSDSINQPDVLHAFSKNILAFKWQA